MTAETWIHLDWCLVAPLTVYSKLNMFVRYVTVFCLSLSSNPPQKVYDLYQKVGYNCFIAAAVYVLCGAFSWCQMRLNKQKVRSLVFLNAFCLKKTAKLLWDRDCKRLQACEACKVTATSLGWWRWVISWEIHECLHLTSEISSCFPFFLFFDIILVCLMNPTHF